MQDWLTIGEWPAAQARYAYAHTTALANRAVLLHECDQLSAHLFARALTAAVLVSPLLQEEERLALRWQYDGALQFLTIEVSAAAAVRGMIGQPRLLGEVREKAEICGTTGRLSLVRSSAGRVLGSSTTAAALFEIVDDLAHHYCTGEQCETALVAMLALSADPAQPIRLCHGFLLQALPGADLLRFDEVRQRLHRPAFRQLLADPPADTAHAARLLHALHDDPTGPPPEATATAGATPLYRCGCTRAKTFASLRHLSPAELRAAYAAAEPLSVRCHFCRQLHVFAPAEYRSLLEPA
jgi:molecular chaperone Hsp33